MHRTLFGRIARCFLVGCARDRGQVLGRRRTAERRRRRLWRPVSRCASFRAVPAAAANGIQISYTDSGGQGPAVVFSHGFLLGHTMFDRQVTALAPQYRVIIWDQRGHGGTRAAGAFTYWNSAADLLALLGHLGVERTVLAGMSQGGFVSLRAALTAADMARRCDGGGFSRSGARWRWCAL